MKLPFHVGVDSGSKDVNPGVGFGGLVSVGGNNIFPILMITAVEDSPLMTYSGSSAFLDNV
ncbi:hypothetical protein V1523DRAFT_427696 [Lipomyces doorenjongii]